MFEILLLIILLAGLAWQRKYAQRLDALEDELQKLSARLAQYEGGPRPALDADAETVTASEPIAEAPAAIAEPAPVESDPGSIEVAAREIESEPAARLPSRKGREKESLESNLGARWAVWVGGVALAFGGIFLIRYSIESGLLGPAARIALAFLFGLLLIGAGEVIRRRAMPQVSERYNNAMIPGALTGAGAVTLLGAVFAAHAIYGYIGPGSAFLLLALVSFATIGLSLLHGQALAGLGLLGSLITPALVTTDQPNANALFIFLAVTWLATNAASRFRNWTVVPMLANIGIGGWALAYILGAPSYDPLPPTLTLIAVIAGTALFWPGSRYGKPAADDNNGGGWFGLLLRPPLKITLSLSFAAVLSALAFIAADRPATGDPAFSFAAIIATLAALGASRRYAFWPALLSAAGAVGGIGLIALTLLNYMAAPAATDGSPIAPLTYTHQIAVSLLLGGIFTLLGFGFLRRLRHGEPEFSSVWAVLMSAVPVSIATISFLNFGDLSRDWTHGLYGIALGLALLAGANWLFRQTDQDQTRIDWPANLLVAGSFAAFAFALHALTNGITTTISLAVLGFAYAMAVRIRPWPALPWVMAAALLTVFARIAWEPTLVGPNSLGTTPFLNALLPGYGIPALLAVVSAYELRRWPDIRIRNLLQALASLMVLMTAAILVRHAMNGGVLNDNVPTLGEQSIYTLLTVGFSAALMTLDLKSPSPIFRYGSMIAGVLATINVLSLHVVGLNPYITGESTGRWPFINLLLIGYLMPALAYAGVAWYARGKRPQPYVTMLAVSGAVLGFLWATLSVRRFWQGEFIAEWKGFLPGETYTYSVVWLVIGVALLALGSKLDARSLRLASAGLVFIAVLKVFLVDMSNLEGILRALSFIGLGAVLIGIGLFYQRILVRKNSAPEPEPAVAAEEQAQ